MQINLDLLESSKKKKKAAYGRKFRTHTKDDRSSERVSTHNHSGHNLIQNANGLLL